MLHLPKPSASSVSHQTPLESLHRTHTSSSSQRSPSPPSSVAASTNPTSPASSWAVLPNGANRQGALSYMPGAVHRERTNATPRPKRKELKVERMSVQELQSTWERNKTVLEDRSIFPPLSSSSPPDPFQSKLLAIQSSLEHRISLLTTQEQFSNSTLSPITSSELTSQDPMSSPSSSSNPALTASTPVVSTSYGARRQSIHRSPLSPVTCASKRGLVDPISMSESIALQSDLFKREKAREVARAAEMERKEAERLAINLANAPGRSGNKLMDELERIRGQARMRAFMNPPIPLSREPFYADDSDCEVSDGLTLEFENDSDEAFDEGEGYPDYADADDGTDGNGQGIIVISQEEIAQNWATGNEGR
ncbi:hypothetical protein [Phaffia rhodozyma]|uniref:Uncharacterized protein n=1 Tax=Phaffia rhodozyma TaxID=264483 RepID=A0A0F7SYX2_PHARH|nr:hypothetical protein [Phaffia rhodozyma]